MHASTVVHHRWALDHLILWPPWQGANLRMRDKSFTTRQDWMSVPSLFYRTAPYRYRWGNVQQDNEHLTEILRPDHFEAMMGFWGCQVDMHFFFRKNLLNDFWYWCREEQIFPITAFKTPIIIKQFPHLPYFWYRIESFLSIFSKILTNWISFGNS